MRWQKTRKIMHYHSRHKLLKTKSMHIIFVRGAVLMERTSIKDSLIFTALLSHSCYSCLNNAHALMAQRSIKKRSRCVCTHTTSIWSNIT